jgi:hypothetical protein
MKKLVPEKDFLNLSFRQKAEVQEIFFWNHLFSFQFYPQSATWFLHVLHYQTQKQMHNSSPVALRTV